LTSVPSISLKHTGTDNVREHPFAKGREDLITTAIKLFAQNDLVITFGVGS
jgi:hypothetical protein